MTEAQLESERKLVRAAQQGDQEAWRALFDEYYPRLYRFVRARVSDDFTAEDLAAEAFADAFRGLPRFRWRGKPFGAWLFRVTRNRVKMHYRSTSGKETAGDPAHHRSVADASLSVEIEDTLSGLPDEYREAIELRYIIGLSGAEAAAAMGRSHGAFRMLLHRATEQFKREFVS